jgi:hypothetical protein
MPIHRPREARSKSHIKDQEAVWTPGDHSGKHELLRTSKVHNALYDYILIHPECTRDEARLACDCNWRRITDLVTEGLVEVVGKRGNQGTLRVIEGGNIGKKRDLLKVQIKIFINDHGEYSAECVLQGQQPGATQGRRIQLVNKTHPIRVPRPREKFLERVVIDDQSQIIDITPSDVKLDD